MISLKKKSRSGQTIIFLLMVLIIIFILVLWNFDLHKILHVKATSQNGGDASALAAARWQGISLNLIGDLNIMHAVALSSSDPEILSTAPAMNRIQSRLCFVGPMMAFTASQQAAKQNKLYTDDDMTALMRNHASKVRNIYPHVFSEPYENAWEEYSQMISAVANNGITAGADNARFFGDYQSGPPLVDVGFYNAISDVIWCWFYHNERGLLEEYVNFHPCWWDPLPRVDPLSYKNSEIYGLGLDDIHTRLTDLTNSTLPFDDVIDARNIEGYISAQTMRTNATWYCYHSSVWGDWDKMSTDRGNYFPLTGTVKDQYYYAGADAATRVMATTDRLSPGPKNSKLKDSVTWISAAKPFGYLDSATKPTQYRIVLPAYHDVRLIPVDSSSRPSGGSANPAWRNHLDNHLPFYMDHGPAKLSGCWYCSKLKLWEGSEFRQTGADWLNDNAGLCNVRTPSGGRGGGTSVGH